MPNPSKAMTRHLFSISNRIATKDFSPKPILSGGYDKNAANNRSYQLFDAAKLGIEVQDREVFHAVNVAVCEYMYGPTFDASHDYEHIQRVVALAHRIYTEHKKDSWAREMDKTMLYVACMVHDVGDRKYHKGDARDQEDIVRDFLKAIGCAPKIWGPAAYIAARVSFTREMKEPERIKVDADNYPAVRIVQDADRLDGLGAIGIGRSFVYGGIHEERRQDSIQSGVELHYNRFEKYLDLMKTAKGKQMAKERLDFMARFRKQWSMDTDRRMVL